MNKAQIIGALNAVLDKDELSKAENAYGKLLQCYLDGAAFDLMDEILIYGLAELNAKDVANVERLIANVIKVESGNVRLLEGADGFGLEVYGEYNRFDILEWDADNVINQVAALWQHWEDGAGEFWLAYEDKGSRLRRYYEDKG